MVIDFFVHPEHPIMTGYPYEKTYQRYLENLRRVHEQSDLPVLVNGLSEGEFSKLFSKDRTVKSNSFFIIDYPLDFGEVRPDDWEKFTDIVDQGHKFRVHGSYFGECTEGFAVQLFGYLKKQEHWCNWSGNLGEGQSIEHKQEVRKRRYFERCGEFADSGIKFGVVIASNMRKIKIRRPSIIPIFGLPHGNITYQLMDDKTVVYKK